MFNKKSTILIVEDEQDIAELIAYNLTRAGFLTTIAKSGEEAIIASAESSFDLILLDLMLPGVDGFTVCRKLKQDDRCCDTPIVMLTARGEDADIITGLEMGADDYIIKPFSPKVLVARINTVLRRTALRRDLTDLSVLEVHGLIIDTKRHEVRRNGEKINFSATEFKMFHFFAKNPGWVFSRSQIISAAKGDDYPVTERSVDVQILGMRKKLKSMGAILETVRGIGYRMIEFQESRSR